MDKKNGHEKSGPRPKGIQLLTSFPPAGGIFVLVVVMID
jgi:hypothetical protein